MNAVFTIAMPAFRKRRVVHVHEMLAVIVEAWFVATANSEQVVHVILDAAQRCPEPLEHHGEVTKDV